MEAPFASPDERLTYSAFFRVVNDNIMCSSGAGTASRQILCECGRPACEKTLETTVAAYRTAREDPTRFLVAPGHELAVNGAVRAVAPIQAAKMRPRPLVLLVDDDAAIRRLCSRCLEETGVVVLEAPDGQRGLEQAVSVRPDLIVTDIAMPVLDGLRLAAALRRDARTEKIPLIFLTGESTNETEARALDLGAFAYLSKPFDPAVLVSVVSGMLALFAGAEHTATDVVTPIRPAAAPFDDPTPSAA
jgi:CheY-like chemotaxis protein